MILICIDTHILYIYEARGCQNDCAQEGILGSKVTRVKSIVFPRAGRPLTLENDTLKITAIATARWVGSRWRFTNIFKHSGEIVVV